MTSLAKIYEIIDIACDRQERDQDWIISICGGTGAGKSSALLWIYLRLCELKGISPDNLDFFCTNIKEFASQFYLSPKSGFLILDEAGDKLSNDTYNSTFNKQLRATLSVVRKKRMIVIIALPYFGRLDTQIRCDRIDVCLQMLMTERGRCVIYDKDLIDQYNELSRKERKNDISKSIYSPETDYSPDFKKHHPVLWEKYLDKVQGKVDSSLLELLQSADETVYSQSKVSRLCKVTKKTVAEWCEVGIGNKVLKHTVSPFNNRVYIKAEDLKEWIDYVQSYKKEQDKLPKINI